MMPRLCASCKKMLLDAIREGASDLHCYKGRVRIYQVLPIFEEIQRIILKHGTVIAISRIRQPVKAYVRCGNRGWSRSSKA